MCVANSVVQEDGVQAVAGRVDSSGSDPVLHAGLVHLLQEAVISAQMRSTGSE